MAKISIYDSLETNFTHNGTVLPDITSCTIEEMLNGKYILELTHPIDEEGKWEYIVEENIIKANGQLFRIHSTDSTLGYVYASARHIFYDLLHNFLEDVRPTNMNGASALNWILSNTQYPHNFIGTSDVDTINTQYYIRKNPVEAMLGPDSLSTRWNGELERDNYTIRLLSSRGQKKGTQIAYGKNMLGLEVKRDMDSVITRMMPVGREGLLLPEKYVESPLINNYTFPRIQKVEFDIGIDENTTEEQAFDKLRQAANKLYEVNKIDIPYININANLLLLETTEEYKHIQNLVKVNLGDIVSCTDNPIKITFEAKVIRIKKDVLSNRNVEVELGQFKQGISSRLENAIKDISELVRNSTSDLETAINNATELLTNALGGHVIKRPGELLIMDTEDPATATQVWRWNVNGLGYSKTGINGPYPLAMTMDGQIVADFITTGTLNAGIIKAGVLASADSSSYINMEDGTFNFKNALKWENNKLVFGEDAIDEVTTITEDAISTATITVDQLEAGTINTDHISLQSTDGKLNIQSKSITIQNTDGSLTTISANGVKVQHSINDYTLLNANGMNRYIGGQLAPYKFLSTTGVVSAWTGYETDLSDVPTQTITLYGNAWKEKVDSLDVSIFMQKQSEYTGAYTEYRAGGIEIQIINKIATTTGVQINFRAYARWRIRTGEFVWSNHFYGINVAYLVIG